MNLLDSFSNMNICNYSFHLVLVLGCQLLLKNITLLGQLNQFTFMVSASLGSLSYSATVLLFSCFIFFLSLICASSRGQITCFFIFESPTLSLLCAQKFCIKSQLLFLRTTEIFGGRLIDTKVAESYES